MIVTSICTWNRTYKRKDREKAQHVYRYLKCTAWQCHCHCLKTWFFQRSLFLLQCSGPCSLSLDYFCHYNKMLIYWVSEWVQSILQLTQVIRLFLFCCCYVVSGHLLIFFLSLSLSQSVGFYSGPNNQEYCARYNELRIDIPDNNACCLVIGGMIQWLGCQSWLVDFPWSMVDMWLLRG